MSKMRLKPWALSLVAVACSQPKDFYPELTTVPCEAGGICVEVCGDDVRNTGEQCDGDDLGGLSCVTTGYQGGALGCTDACVLDFSNCLPLVLPPTEDSCPLDDATGFVDTDGDSHSDRCDNCPDAYNPEQTDLNGDGLGDKCGSALLLNELEPNDASIPTDMLQTIVLRPTSPIVSVLGASDGESISMSDTDQYVLRASSEGFVRARAKSATGRVFVSTEGHDAAEEITLPISALQDVVLRAQLVQGTPGPYRLSLTWLPEVHCAYPTPWSSEVVDSSSATGGAPSIAVASNGDVHMTYTDPSNQALNYVSNALGFWGMVSIDDSSTLGTQASIALDGFARLHIGFYDITSSSLKHATLSTETWEISTVAFVNTLDSAVSIAVDAGGRARLIYHENGELRLANNMTGDWVWESVDTAGDVGSHADLVLDSIGRIHISYYDATQRHLKYAQGTTGDLTTQIIDAWGDVGRYTSIALDPSGAAHVSYYDALSQRLKYATNAPGFWIREFVAETDSAGASSAIAVDAEGIVHLSFVDGAGQLTHATRFGDFWLTQPIEVMGTASETTAIGIGASGDVHVGFHSGGNLRLARRSCWVRSEPLGLRGD